MFDHKIFKKFKKIYQIALFKLFKLLDPFDRFLITKEWWNLKNHKLCKLLLKKRYASYY